jgi:hypothetical protein
LEGLIESQKAIPTMQRCFARDQKSTGLRQLGDVRRDPPRLGVKARHTRARAAQLKDTVEMRGWFAPGAAVMFL